jgi:hypothetical protein
MADTCGFCGAPTRVRLHQIRAILHQFQANSVELECVSQLQIYPSTAVSARAVAKDYLVVRIHSLPYTDFEPRLPGKLQKLMSSEHISRIQSFQAENRPFLVVGRSL